MIAQVSDADRVRIATALAELLRCWPDDAGRERREYRRLQSAFGSETFAGGADRESITVKLMTAAEFADTHGLTPQAVTARCRRGTLPAHRVRGGWVIEVRP